MFNTQKLRRLASNDQPYYTCMYVSLFLEYEILHIIFFSCIFYNAPWHKTHHTLNHVMCPNISNKEDRWIFTPDFFMGHWSVAFSECETDPIFKKITVNYEKNAYEKSVNFWELCEALQWEWCLYDVCSTRLYCYDLHLLPAVQKVQPASQARAVTSLNSFTVPGLFQTCTSHVLMPQSPQIQKYEISDGMNLYQGFLEFTSNSRKITFLSLKIEK